MVIKEKIQEWASETWDKHVKQPVANKTKELEDQVTQQVNKYSSQAQTYNPANYYWKQEAFYRGLFWIAILALIVLWMISGS